MPLDARKTTTKPVSLSRHLADEIVNHALEGLPEEVCGIIRGRRLDAYEVVRGRNVAQDRTRNYTLDADTLLRQFEFEDAGDEMMGVYHSHPATEAYPSPTDAWLAHYPDAVYFICSLQKPKTPVIRAYHLHTTRIDIKPEQIRIVLPFEEARPGIHATHIPAEMTLPSTLRALNLNLRTPAYILHEDVPSIECRLVRILELPIQSDVSSDAIR